MNLRKPQSKNQKNPRIVARVCVLMYNESTQKVQIYLQQKSIESKAKGNYELPGGNVDLGEDIKNGAFREYLEESLEAVLYQKFSQKYLDQLRLINTIKISDDKEAYVFAFLIDYNDSFEMSFKNSLEEDKLISSSWVDLEDYFNYSAINTNIGFNSGSGPETNKEQILDFVEKIKDKILKA